MKRKAPAISKVPGESTPRECVDVEKQHETQKKQKGDELPSTNKANPDDNLKKRKKERKEKISFAAANRLGQIRVHKLQKPRQTKRTTNTKTKRKQGPPTRARAQRQ